MKTMSQETPASRTGPTSSRHIHVQTAWTNRIGRRALVVAAMILPASTTTLAQDGLVGRSALRQAGLTAYWQADVPVPAEDEVTAGYLVDDALYVYTKSGIAFSIQSETGLIRWAQQLSDQNFTVLKPAHVHRAGNEQLAIIMTSADTFVIDRYSGRIRKRFSIDFPLGGPPVGVGGLLVAGSADGHLRAVLWDTHEVASAQLWWVVRAGGPITTQPIFFGEDQIIAASHGGQVFSCAAEDKAYIWGFRAGDAVLGDPFLDAGNVYVASADRSLYKLAARDGHVFWRHRTGSPLTDGPVVVDDIVYQYVAQRGLVALNTDSGAEIRRFPEASAFIAHLGNRIALRNERAEIQLFDRATGTMTATIPTRNAKIVQNLDHDAIYVIGARGRTLCLRAEDASYLRPSEMASARARLNEAPRADRDDHAGDVTGDSAGKSRRDPLRSRRDRAGGSVNR